MQTFKPSTIIPALALAALLASPLTARAADKYDIDPVHSSVVFKVKHFGVGYQYGLFRKVTGKLTVDAKKPANSSVTVVLDAASVFTSNKKRDAHLRGPDFLNTKQYPKISFTSTRVRKAGKQLTVTGKLSLHGKTRPVTVKLELVGQGKDPWGNTRIGFAGNFTVNRSDYGITKMPGGVGEKLHLMLAFEGIKKK